MENVLYEKYKDDERVAIFHWALFSPMRQFVIEKIKDPLREGIEKAQRLKQVIPILKHVASLLPKITKKNTICHNTHILEDKLNALLLNHRNRGRKSMVESGSKILKFEYEHDGYYRWLFDYMLIELAMELVRGNWIPEYLQFPEKSCWSGSDLPDYDTLTTMFKEALDERPHTLLRVELLQDDSRRRQGIRTKVLRDSITTA